MGSCTVRRKRCAHKQARCYTNMQFTHEFLYAYSPYLCISIPRVAASGYLGNVSRFCKLPLVENMVTSHLHDKITRVDVENAW